MSLAAAAPSPRLDHVRWHIGGAALAALFGLVLYAVGPYVFPPGRAGHERAPFLYMIAVFPFFGLLAAEVLLHRGTAAGRHLLGEGVALAALAFGRLFGVLAASGHVMMMVWFILGMRAVEPPALRRVELALAAATLAAFLFTKMVLWHDLWSPVLGAALALLVRAVSVGLRSRAGLGRTRAR